MLRCKTNCLSGWLEFSQSYRPRASNNARGPYFIHKKWLFLTCRSSLQTIFTLKICICIDVDTKNRLVTVYESLLLRKKIKLYADSLTWNEIQWYTQNWNIIIIKSEKKKTFPKSTQLNIFGYQKLIFHA